MARNIYDAESRAARQSKVGKAELNGDAAFLLLFEAIGIYACQGLDQSGLSVINVPRCSQHYPFGH